MAKASSSTSTSSSPVKIVFLLLLLLNGALSFLFQVLNPCSPFSQGSTTSTPCKFPRGTMAPYTSSSHAATRRDDDDALSTAATDSPIPLSVEGREKADKPNEDQDGGQIRNEEELSITNDGHPPHDDDNRHSKSSTSPTATSSLSRVSDLALWELLRELNHRQIVYNVLQSRQELNQLLLQARRQVGIIEEDDEEKEDSKSLIQQPSSYSFPVPPTVGHDDDETIATGSSGSLFHSLDEALAWASQLTEDELQKELDFLSIDEVKRSTSSHDDSIQLLARSVVSRRADVEEEDSMRKRSRFSYGKRAQEGGAWGIRRRGTPFKPKSTKQQQQQRPRHGGIYGKEELYMDIDGARETLAARWKQLTNRSRDRQRSPSIDSQAQKGAERRGQPTRRALSREDEGDDDDDLEGWEPRGSSDMFDVVFDRVTRATDRALDWATKAKSRAESVARDAYFAASEELGGVQKRGGKKRSTSILGPRGQRFSRLSGLMAKAGAETMWQMAISAAAWAGGGLLPGKYVLLGVGAATLLLRNGLGTFMATLVVVRTCSTTVKSMLLEEDEMGMTGDS